MIFWVFVVFEFCSVLGVIEKVVNCVNYMFMYDVVCDWFVFMVVVEGVLKLLGGFVEV